jgi:hypothetical protein
VAPLSLREVTADPVQRPSLVKRLGLTTRVVEVTVDAQRLVLSLGGSQIITRHPPHDPQVEEGVGLAEPVTEVTVDGKGQLMSLGRSRVITRRLQHVPQVEQGIGLAAPVANVSVYAQCMLQGLGRGRGRVGHVRFLESRRFRLIHPRHNVTTRHIRLYGSVPAARP